MIKKIFPSELHAFGHEEEIIALRKELYLLKKSHQDLYDFAPYSYFILDHEYKILSVNLMGASQLGIDRALLVDKSFLTFVAFNSKMVFQNQIASMLKSKNRETYEIELLQKGNKRLLSRVDCFYLENNTILVTSLDVTYEKEMESKLLELESSLFLLENIIKASSDAIAVLDIHFYFKKLNNAFVDSFSKIFAVKAKVGMNFNIIIADFPELRNEINNACSQSISGKEVCIKIENDCDKEAAYYCYEVFFKPFCDQNSTIVRGIACIIKNISEIKLNQRRRLKQQSILANADRMHSIGEMAAAFAHEINQPLAAINVYSHTCLTQCKNLILGDKKLLKGLEQISSLSQHTGEILHRMKNFIREGELRFEKVDINSVIRQAITFIDHQKLELKFNIYLMLDEAVPPILLDKVKVIQVILNLSQNSVEAFQSDNRSNLEITISTCIVGQYVEVHFKDNGPGIPNELTEKIMKSYFTTKPHGTGLGLGICRTLIEAHGGRLKVKPSNHQGAHIHFTIPLNKKEI